MLASLAAAYVEAINTGSVPTIASAWKSVVEVESARALDDAKALYDKRCGAMRCLGRIVVGISHAKTRLRFSVVDALDVLLCPLSRPF